MISQRQSFAFDRPYLCNDHSDRYLFQEIFVLLILFLFPRNSFEQSWTCFLGIQTHLQNTKNKSVFYLSFFTCCFVIILCINALHLSILFCCMLTHRMSLFSFFIVVLQSLCVLSTLWAWTGSLKQTLLPRKFSRWSLNFLKTRLNSAEIRMSKLSKV